MPVICFDKQYYLKDCVDGFHYFPASLTSTQISLSGAETAYSLADNSNFLITFYIKTYDYWNNNTDSQYEITKFGTKLTLQLNYSTATNEFNAIFLLNTESINNIFTMNDGSKWINLTFQYISGQQS